MVYILYILGYRIETTGSLFRMYRYMELNRYVLYIKSIQGGRLSPKVQDLGPGSMVRVLV